MLFAVSVVPDAGPIVWFCWKANALATRTSTAARAWICVFCPAVMFAIWYRPPDSFTTAFCPIVHVAYCPGATVCVTLSAMVTFVVPGVTVGAAGSAGGCRKAVTVPHVALAPCVK